MISPDLGRRGWRRTGNRRERGALLLPMAGIAWVALALSVVVGGPVGWTLLCALASVLVSVMLLVRLCLR